MGKKKWELEYEALKQKEFAAKKEALERFKRQIKGVSEKDYAEQQRRDQDLERAEVGRVPLKKLIDSSIEADIFPKSGGNERTLTDYAPVRENTGYLQKGAFSKGVSVANIGKAILGTNADIGLNVVQGAGNFFEGIGDSGLYLLSGLSALQGKKYQADMLKVQAQMNLTNLLTGDAEDALDKWSVAGDKTTGVAEGIGYIGGMVSAGALGKAAGLSQTGLSLLNKGAMFLSNTGGGINEAYENGATDGQAVLYGMMVGAAETMSESIFSGLGKGVQSFGVGIGMSSADDMLAKKLTSKISSTIAKNLIQFGIKSASEGVEEVLSGLASAVAKKATYMSEEDLGKIISNENLLEEFVQGSLVSAVMQSGIVPGTKSGSLIETTKKGQEFLSGMTASEQRVIDKMVEERIAQMSQDGQKPTGSYEAELRAELGEQAQWALETGQISVEDIERVLGGEEYTAYKEAYANEDTLIQEYNDLMQTKKSEITMEQDKRLAELEGLIEDAKNHKNSNELGKKMRSGVYEQVKDSRLAESYAEFKRSGEAFTADVSQYAEAERATVQDAIDSGLLNDTKQTHDFVDLVAKLAAKRGMAFHFADNQSLKDSGFSVKNAIINGFVNADGITLNIDSAKALNTVVGHEITHVMEGSELYGDLQEALFDFAKKKGEYDSRRAMLEELYADTEADIDGELTADLVGDYLFTDKNFIKRLSTEHRNLAQRLYDEVKYLCRLATGMSKEARQLERLKKTFEETFRENKNTLPEDTKAETKKESKKARKTLATIEDIRESESTGEDIAPVKAETAENTAETNIPEEEGDKEDGLSASKRYKNEKQVRIAKEFQAMAKGKTQEAFLKEIQKAYAERAVKYAGMTREDGKNLPKEQKAAFYRWLERKTIMEDIIKQKGNFDYSIPGLILNSENITAPIVDTKTGELLEDYAPVRKDAGNSESEKEVGNGNAIAPILDTRTGDFTDGVEPAVEEKQDTSEDTEPGDDLPENAHVRTGIQEKTVTEQSTWSRFEEAFLDKGMVFENLAKKHKNRELEAKWDMTRHSQAKAQYFLGNGSGKGETSLADLYRTVEESGKMNAFQDYLAHWLNVDRMTVRHRIANTEHHAVFGENVTAKMSREKVAQWEQKYPDFKKWAKELYQINDQLLQMQVDAGIITEDSADAWKAMYPHYVPIHRITDVAAWSELLRNSKRVGIDHPKGLKGPGGLEMGDIFVAMAGKASQVFSAVDKNAFAVELLNTLGEENATLNEKNEGKVIDSVLDGDGVANTLVTAGENGMAPMASAYIQGKRMDFPITEAMYKAMTPAKGELSKTHGFFRAVSTVHKGILTEYNPLFTVTNIIKDLQDVLFNSQHAAKTYLMVLPAIKELRKNGEYLQEYTRNGGGDLTYFDRKKGGFDTKAEKKLGINPLKHIAALNNFVEKIPRLAEYMASRKAGRSIEVSMLDAARVTTNFAAGGDVAKYLNRNGCTFLNASIQGAVQQARNIREARMNGFKGWLQYATRVTLAGLPLLVINALRWDDDEEYQELSDYVKRNYYIVDKFGDGQFVRIPKGRMAAVWQDAFQQISNLITGDDELDLAAFLDLAVTNLAPNNPLDNNVIAPIYQAAKNKSWYGEDIVPQRLQNLPEGEQYDESTDILSKWLGEKIHVSPKKLNYVLDQYSGVLGDFALPMMTPEAEADGSGLLDYMIAPVKDKFTVDSTMKNQNTTDFYNTVDKVTKKANSAKATDKDILMRKYLSGIQSEVSAIAKTQRNAQKSSLSNHIKYAQIRKLKQNAVERMKQGMENYTDVEIDGGYARVADTYYRKDKDGEWGKITDKQLKKMVTAMDYLDISEGEYWNNHEEYDFATEYPDRYAVASAVGGYDAYIGYAKEMNAIESDKDANGETIANSRKKKVTKYINGLDISYTDKMILYKSAYKGDDRYNREIVSRVSKMDMEYADKVELLQALGATVSNDGRVRW